MPSGTYLVSPLPLNKPPSKIHPYKSAPSGFFKDLQHAMLHFVWLPNFPFIHLCSAWGESFLMSMQDVLLVVLYFVFNGQVGMTFVFLPVYAGSFYVLSSGITPQEILAKLQACCVVIMASSKVRLRFSGFE